MLFILKHFWTTLTHIQQKDFKGPFSQSYGFFSTHVWTWESDHKESWAPKNWCFWTVVLEKTLRVPWATRRSSQSEWKSILDTHWKDWCCSWSSNTSATRCEEPTHWKRPWCWKDWRQEEKGTTEDEMIGWHPQLNGHEFEQAPAGGEGQGSLVYCSPWGRRESNTTERLNNNKFQ